MTIVALLIGINFGLNLFLSDETFGDVFFFHRVGFSGHCGFVGGHFGAFDEPAICWDLHSGLDSHDVSHKYFGLMDNSLRSRSENVNHFSGVGNIIKLLELFFFLVIIDCGDRRANADSNKDGKSFNPSSFGVIGCRDFDDDGDCCGDHKNF